MSLSHSTVGLSRAPDASSLLLGHLHENAVMKFCRLRLKSDYPIPLRKLLHYFTRSFLLRPATTHHRILLAISSPPSARLKGDAP
jgi:hypothetical protein